MSTRKPKDNSIVEDDAPSGLPTHLADIPDYYKEALAYHEAFRRLEFPAEQIYLSVQESRDQPGLMTIGVELRLPTRPEKTFLCSIVMGIRESAGRLESLWHRAVILWNTSKDQDARDAIWTNSHVRKNAVIFHHALLEKGILKCDGLPWSITPDGQAAQFVPMPPATLWADKHGKS